MDILFLTTDDPTKKELLWAGIALVMLRRLESLGHRVHVQAVGHNFSYPYQAIKWRYYRWLRGEQYFFDYNPMNVWFAKRQVRRALRGVSYDLAFSWQPWHLLLIETDKPKVFWYDTTFIKTQPLYCPDICRQSLKDALRWDGQIAREADAAIYSSEWAAQSAITDYGADRAHVHAIPFGANMETPSAEILARSIETRVARQNEPVRLLFVGIDWQRKGGKTALEVTREINRRGMRARLTIVGAQRPELTAEEAAVADVMGRLSKSQPAELERLRTLYLESDFFIMTSHADSSPIVYCEALAHACPILATRTGGVSEIVRDGVTGRLVDWSANTVSEIADYVIKVRGDQAAYRALCQSCQKSSATEFNWDVSFRRLEMIFDQVTGKTKNIA